MLEYHMLASEKWTDKRFLKDCYKNYTAGMQRAVIAHFYFWMLYNFYYTHKMRKMRYSQKELLVTSLANVFCCNVNVLQNIFEQFDYIRIRGSGCRDKWYYTPLTNEWCGLSIPASVALFYNVGYSIRRIAQIFCRSKSTIQDLINEIRDKPDQFYTAQPIEEWCYTEWMQCFLDIDAVYQAGWSARIGFDVPRSCVIKFEEGFLDYAGKVQREGITGVPDRMEQT